MIPIEEMIQKHLTSYRRRRAVDPKYLILSEFAYRVLKLVASPLTADEDDMTEYRGMKIVRIIDDEYRTEVRIEFGTDTDETEIQVPKTI